MDKETYNLMEALKRAGFSDKKIQAFLKDFEIQLHERVINKLLNDGHSLEDAEALYQKAKTIIEEEDQELILKLIRGKGVHKVDTTNKKPNKKKERKK